MCSLRMDESEVIGLQYRHQIPDGQPKKMIVKLFLHAKIH